MFFYLGFNREILSFSGVSYELGKEDLKEDMIEFFDIDFSFEYSPNKDGFERKYYLEKDGVIRTEYEEIPEVVKTETELKLMQMAFDISYLSMLIESREV